MGIPRSCPKMEVLYHISPYFVGIIPHCRRYIFLRWPLKTNNQITYKPCSQNNSWNYSLISCNWLLTDSHASPWVKRLPDPGVRGASGWSVHRTIPGSDPRNAPNPVAVWTRTANICRLIYGYMDYIWIIYMDYIWMIYGLYMVDLWWSYGESMDNLWWINGSVVGGWPNPLKNMKVNWDDDIPNIWENKKSSKPPTSFNVSYEKKTPLKVRGCSEIP